MAYLGAALMLTAILFGLHAIRKNLRRSRLGRTDCLIGEAMSAYGIAPVDAEAAGLEVAMQQAARDCQLCASKRQCRAWLVDPSGTGTVECCNAAFFVDVAAHKRASNDAKPVERNAHGLLYDWRP